MVGGDGGSREDDEGIGWNACAHSTGANLSNINVKSKHRSSRPDHRRTESHNML